MHKSQKRIAKWTGNKYRVFRQIWTSIKSCITFPLTSFKHNAAKDYFLKIHSGHNDDLLFDGKNNDYLEPIKNVFDITKLNNSIIYDLGCGNGSLYQWISDDLGITINKYVGIDFSHSSIILSDNAIILNKDLRFISKVDLKECKFIFLINVLCYLEDKIVNCILKSLPSNIEIIIIEPIPGLFWDVHFDNIKLHYRNPDTINQILSNYQIECKNSSIDYYTRLSNNYLFPLSYCCYAIKDNT